MKKYQKSSNWWASDNFITRGIVSLPYLFFLFYDSILLINFLFLIIKLSAMTSFVRTIVLENLPDAVTHYTVTTTVEIKSIAGCDNFHGRPTLSTSN